MPISVAGTGAITGASSLNGLAVPTDSIAPAMVLVASQAFNSASSVSINGCFTSNYVNYRIMLSVVVSSGMNILGRMRINGVDDSSANYIRSAIYNNSGSAAAATVTGQTSWELSNINTQAPPTVMAMDIWNPATASRTKIQQVGGPWVEASGQFWRSGVFGFDHDVASAFDGITFFTSSGTITGNIRVYGYRN